MILKSHGTRLGGTLFPHARSRWPRAVVCSAAAMSWPSVSDECAMGGNGRSAGPLATVPGSRPTRKLNLSWREQDMNCDSSTPGWSATLTLALFPDSPSSACIALQLNPGRTNSSQRRARNLFPKMVFHDRPVYQEEHAAQLIMARRPNLSPIEGRIHLRRPVDPLFAFPSQSDGGPYISGSFGTSLVRQADFSAMCLVSHCR